MTCSGQRLLDVTPLLSTLGATSPGNKPSDDGGGDTSPATRTPFRHKVFGNKQCPPSREMKDLFQENLARIEIHRLPKIYKLKEGFDLLEIDNGYFMVQFDLEPNRALVMEDGPWVMFDHYLTVQTCILMACATVVGLPVKVDVNSRDIHRGKFSRVCAEIDLNKQMVSRVWLGTGIILSMRGCTGAAKHVVATIT
ncbi:hypothetical protein JHK82_018710 [Glycine max]|nr:hypothetical protein JHK85_019152 [Glycine max]KAG5037894.1 hypothetical protein JHK86_018734 [Glycine max]KAG5143015.1 hypothetical protein JHK82_018710 [Glycine max]